MGTHERTPLDNMLLNSRVFVLVGPYGTGKTEVAVNLALRLAAQGRRTALADLDIVSPYFRSREREEVLAQAGVRLIAPPRMVRAADLPSVPHEVFAIIHDRGLTGLIDVGGERQGAQVLKQFAKPLGDINPEVWYVLNQSRLGEVDAQIAAQQLRLVEGHSGLTITGIINNTHLLHETDLNLVGQGAAFAEETAKAAGLPVVFHAIRKDLAAQKHGLSPVLPLTLYNKRPWE